MLRVIFLTLINLLSICTLSSAEESFTLTTYYPSPYGVYNELRLYPHSPATVSCEAAQEGLMFYDSDTDKRNLYVCRYNGSAYVWESFGGYWALNGNNIYNTNNSNNGNVGIRTGASAAPNAALQVNGAISRQGTTLIGTNADTHVNLGVNSVTGRSGFNLSYCTIGGGLLNTVIGNYATIGGGSNNLADNNNSTIAGGSNNTARSSSFVGGGNLNNADGGLSVIGGGNQNRASASYSAIGGGNQNQAWGASSTVAGGGNNLASGAGATIGGGFSNSGPNRCATVGGGERNQVQADYGMIAGGLDNAVFGAYSFAAGRRARANEAGTFVWADSEDLAYNSNGVNTFNIRASGGVYYGAVRQWDIAEEMNVLKKDNLQPAELVSLGGDDLLVKSSSAYDSNLIGVVSSPRTTTLHLQSLSPAKENTQKRYISLVGRVYVKVNNQNGAIKVGDPITSSSTPGIGMKAKRTCKIVGYAMQQEDFKNKAQNEILVFLNLGYFVPVEQINR